MVRRVLALFAALALSGCTAPPGPTAGASDTPAALPLDYGPIDTRLLGDDLVNFTLAMRGAEGPADLRAYGDCAAAQYALIRGYGFARHIRTSVTEDEGLWRSDAVYTISAAIPRGTQTLDAEVTVANCREAGIPTV